jgi:hypothetical protein
MLSYYWHVATGAYPGFTRDINHVDYWCERAERIASKFTTLMGESPFHYIDTLYHLYLINQNNDTFRDATITVAHLQTSIRRYQDSVLQLTGVGKEWARCEKIGMCVSDVLKALEDILCHGMADMEDLVVCYARRELLYQSLPST